MKIRIITIFSLVDMISVQNVKSNIMD